VNSAAPGRFGTDRDGSKAMLAAGRKRTDRVWAVGGRVGVGRHVARRLVADGETVLDGRAKLSARVRVDRRDQLGRRHTESTPATGASTGILHLMAVVQLRHDTEGRRYYRRPAPLDERLEERSGCRIRPAMS
jgi:hypothetical protein